MKKLKAQIEIQVPEDTEIVILNPIQHLTGRIVKTMATAEGLPDVKERIPASITPILMITDGADVGRFTEGKEEPLEQPYKAEKVELKEEFIVGPG